MTVVILGEAEREFAESVAYYESKEAGLGRFLTEGVQSGWLDRKKSKAVPSEAANSTATR
jgi:hypothetical protein